MQSIAIYMQRCVDMATSHKYESKSSHLGTYSAFNNDQ